MGPAVRRFWVRRWYRTLPSYLATVALYGAALAFPHHASTDGFPWLYLVFAQTYALGRPDVFGHSWTLAVEEHFYVVLPLIVAACARAGWRRPCSIAGVVCVLGAALAAWRIVSKSAGVDVNEALTHLRADGLVVGVALAAAAREGGDAFPAVRRHVGAARAGAALAVGAACALDLAGWPAAQAGIAVAFGAVVALAASDPALARLGATRPVATVARLSYAIYLVHQLAQPALRHLLFGGAIDGAREAALHVILTLLLTGAAAWVLHATVERPFLRLRERRAPPLRGAADGR